MDSILSFFGTDVEAARTFGLKLVTIWILMAFAWWFVGVAARRVVTMADDGDDGVLSHGEKRASTVAGLMSGAGRFLVLVLTVILSLDVFMEIGPILAGAGVLGLAISFGAQSLVKDVISGFFIILENQFDVGDVIKAGDLAGGVEKMTLRVSMLRDLHGVLHIIPNGHITTVSNMTRGWSRSVLDIGVSYDSDIDRVIEVMKEEVERFTGDKSWSPRFDGESNVVGVQALGDSAVSVRVMLRTIPGSQWDVGREFMRRAKVRLDHEGIEIPFPQRTVHMRPLGPGADGSTQ